MAKQQFKFTLGNAQVAAACEAYMRNLTEPGYELHAVVAPGTAVSVVVTRMRATRKAKAPKVAAVPKVAAA